MMHSTTETKGLDFICANGHFGTDPAPGLRKICEYEKKTVVWVFCAHEGERCQPPTGAQHVRFGYHGKFTSPRASEPTFICAIAHFKNVDPVPGLRK